MIENQISKLKIKSPCLQCAPYWPIGQSHWPVLGSHGYMPQSQFSWQCGP